MCLRVKGTSRTVTDPAAPHRSTRQGGREGGWEGPSNTFTPHRHAARPLKDVVAVPTRRLDRAKFTWCRKTCKPLCPSRRKKFEGNKSSSPVSGTPPFFVLVLLSTERNVSITHAYDVEDTRDYETTGRCEYVWMCGTACECRPVWCVDMKVERDRGSLRLCVDGPVPVWVFDSETMCLCGGFGLVSPCRCVYLPVHVSMCVHPHTSKVRICRSVGLCVSLYEPLRFWGYEYLSRSDLCVCVYTSEHMCG